MQSIFIIIFLNFILSPFRTYSHRRTTTKHKYKNYRSFLSAKQLTSTSASQLIQNISDGCDKILSIFFCFFSANTENTTNDSGDNTNNNTNNSIELVHTCKCLFSSWANQPTSQSVSQPTVRKSLYFFKFLFLHLVRVTGLMCLPAGCRYFLQLLCCLERIPHEENRNKRECSCVKR